MASSQLSLVDGLREWYQNSERGVYLDWVRAVTPALHKVLLPGPRKEGRKGFYANEIIQKQPPRPPKRKKSGCHIWWPSGILPSGFPSRLKGGGQLVRSVSKAIVIKKWGMKDDGLPIISSSEVLIYFFQAICLACARDVYLLLLGCMVWPGKRRLPEVTLRQWSAIENGERLFNRGNLLFRIWNPQYWCDTCSYV